MPFKSKAQRRKFYALKNEGKMDQKTIDEWESETPENIPETVEKEAMSSLIKNANFKRHALSFLEKVKGTIGKSFQDVSKYDSKKAKSLLKKVVPPATAGTLLYGAAKKPKDRFGKTKEEAKEEAIRAREKTLEKEAMEDFIKKEAKLASENLWLLEKTAAILDGVDLKGSLGKYEKGVKNYTKDPEGTDLSQLSSEIEKAFVDKANEEETPWWKAIMGGGGIGSTLAGGAGAALDALSKTPGKSSIPLALLGGGIGSIMGMSSKIDDDDEITRAQNAVVDLQQDQQTRHLLGQLRNMRTEQDRNKRLAMMSLQNFMPR